MSLPPPSILLGLNDSHLSSWFPGQESAFKGMMDWYYSPSRFLGLSLPTGGGKSCLSILLSRMSGARTCILTATKGLQNQLRADFGSISSVVMGQNNFTCTLVPSLRADEGPCHDGLPCAYSKSGGCPYRDQLKAALDADIVITNYAYYLAQTNFSSGLGDFDLLVCDEGHLAFSAMENHLSIFLSNMDIETQGLTFPQLPELEPSVVKHRKKKKTAESGTPDNIPNIPDIWGIWVLWAESSAPVVRDRATDLESEIRDLRDLGDPVPGALSRAYRTAKSVLAKLDAMSAAKGDWVIQRTRSGYLFTPRWVSGYSNSLFGSIPKVLLMSAILSPKTCDYLGVANGDSRSWMEVDSYFPAANTPIWHVPTARINYLTDDFGATIWQSRIDQIIQRRLDRKGIIFTVSYERARMLMSRSRFKDIMLTHSTSDVIYVVNKFKAMKPPAILVSPSVTTGYDFPGYGVPQYIIVGKLPYPDTRDPVMKARHEDDKEWSSYLAMETLIQESGRMTRCLSWDTQILTENGWCGADEIREGDMVYSLLPHNFRKGTVRAGGLSLNPVRGVHVWDNDKELVNVVGASLDILVTADHDLVILPYGQGRAVTYRYRNQPSRAKSVNTGIKMGLAKSKAGNLPPRFKVLVSGHVQRERGGVLRSKPMSVRDDWMFLMGLIISDGYMSKNKNSIVISQSSAKGSICEAITGVLDRLGLSYGFYKHDRAGSSMSVNGGKVYKRNGDQFNWKISGYDSIRIRHLFLGTDWERLPTGRGFVRRPLVVVGNTIPLWVLQNCRKRELRSLLNGLMAGDGTWTSSDSGTYYTSDKELADRVQYLLVLADYRSRVRERRNQYEIQFHDNQFVDIPKSNVKVVAYTGKTWCVSTDLGTIVTRRNGCTAIVGNSASDKTEVLVVDDNIKWFMGRYGNFAPGWFRDRYRGSLSAVPDPLF